MQGQITGAVIGAVCVWMIGLETEHRQRHRVKELEQFIRMLQYITGELEARQMLLEDILQHVAIYTKGGAKQMALALSEQIKKPGQAFLTIWEQEIDMIYQKEGFTMEEIEAMKQCAVAFIYAKKEQIVNQSRKDEKRMMVLLENRRAKMHKEQGLIRCLSISGGFAFFIFAC